MIKKLHYVWFGGKPLPANVKSCINSWKKNCPDWEIVQWDETRVKALLHKYNNKRSLYADIVKEKNMN